jgi:hypothetical protein
MRPVTVDPNNVQAAINEIMRASHEADTTEIATKLLSRCSFHADSDAAHRQPRLLPTPT